MEALETVLELSVPADVENLRSVRLMAADAAVQAGFDEAEVDDVRVAVSELCRTCLETSTVISEDVVVHFTVIPGRVTVRGFVRVGPEAESLHLSRVSETLLTATVDEFALSGDEIVARFSFVKQGGGSPD